MSNFFANFTAANGTNLNGHVDDSGATWVVPAPDTWDIQSNAANHTGGTGHRFAGVNTGEAVGLVTAKIAVVGNSPMGVGIRFSSDGSSGFKFETDGTMVRLSRLDGFTRTQLTTLAMTVVAGDTLSMAVDGSNNFTCKVNGVTVLTFTDATYATNVYAGLVVGETGTFNARWEKASFAGATPLPAVKLGLVRNPAGAGSTWPFVTEPQFEYLDFNDVRVTSATGNVTLSVQTGTGTLIGTVVKAGVAGFVDFTGLGTGITGGVGVSHTLRATSATGGVATVDTGAFTVVASTAAVKIGVNTQPVGFTQEDLFSTQPKFNLLDGGGSVATGNTDTVTIAYSTGSKGKFLSGTTSVAAVAGVASFTNLKPRGWGACSWTASAPGLASVTTNALSPTGSFDGPAELPRATPSKVAPVIDVTFTETAATIQARINTIRTIGDALNYRIRISDSQRVIGTTTIPIRSVATTGYLVIEAFTLPAVPNTWVRPIDFTVQATFETATNQPAIEITSGVNSGYVRLVGLRVIPQPGNTYNSIAGVDGIYGLIRIGQSDNPTAANCPPNCTVDRCWVNGGLGYNTQEGIVDSGQNTAIIYSRISEIYSRLNDSQCYTNVTGQGPVLLEHCYFEASGEGFIFGGSDSSVVGTTPADITIRNVYSGQPLGLQTQPPGYPSVFIDKNRGELKNAKRVLVEGCLFKHQWPGQQEGTAFLITPVNQSGTAVLPGVRDVTFRLNVVQSCCGFIDMTANNSPNPAASIVPGQQFTIHDNVAVDLTWDTDPGVNHRMFLVGSTVSDVHIKHNTLLSGAGGSKFLVFSGYPSYLPLRLQVEDNIVSTTFHDYSIVADGVSPGLPSLLGSMPDLGNGATFDRNIFIGIVDLTGQPTAPLAYHQSSEAGVGFVDRTVARTGDVDPDLYLAGLALTVGSPYHNFAPGPKDSGADITALRAAMSGTWRSGEISLIPVSTHGRRRFGSARTGTRTHR